MVNPLMRKFLILLVLLFACRVDATIWYVSTNATAGGTGSIGNPYKLQTAFNAVGTIVAGDTLYLRGGVYTNIPFGTSPGNPGKVFEVRINGSTPSPILIMSYPGEIAMLDGGDVPFPQATARPTIAVGSSGNTTLGSHTIFRDLYVFSSSLEPRVTNDEKSNPTNLFRSEGFALYASDVKVQNCVVYDTANGISTFGTAMGPQELYGNLVFNNGWSGPSQQHGHGMYLQNTLSLPNKNVFSNVCVNAYANSIQCFGSSDAEVYHFRVFGNTFYNNTMSFGGRSGTPQGDNQINGNFYYNSILLFLYHYSTNSISMQVCNNYIANGYLQGGAWTNCIITNNTVANNSYVWKLITSPFCNVIRGWDLDRNNYFVGSNPGAGTWWKDEGCKDMNFGNWQLHGTNLAGVAGWDLNSTVSAPLPTTNLVVLQQNVINTNRATLNIYNWSQGATATASLASLGWPTTEPVRVRSNQNYFGDIATNSIPGFILTLPMTTAAHSVAIPRGASVAHKPNTFPLFGSFTLERLTNNVPVPTNVITIASTNASGAVIVATSDLNGNANGTTTFTRNYLNGTPVSFTAPATLTTNNFSHWSHAGTNFSPSMTIGFDVSGNETYTAVYVAPPIITWTINVGSTNPATGVSVTVTPNDNAALGNGTTPFSRNYNDGVVIVLDASPTAGGNNFARWEKSGVTYSTKTEITFTANSATLVTNLADFVAVYQTPASNFRSLLVNSIFPASGVNITVSLADTNGQSSGVTSFTRVYGIAAFVQVTAPVTSPSGSAFVEWQDELGNSLGAGNLSSSFFMNVNRTRVAFYTNAPLPDTINTGKALSRRRGTRN